MTIDDVYVDLNNISSVKYNFKQICGFESVFKNMMRHLYKYLSIFPELWGANCVFADWVECYIRDDKYSHDALTEVVKSSYNQTFGYGSYFLIPFDEVNDWRIIIYKSESIDCSVVYFVNASIGTIEISFRLISGFLTSSVKKLKDIV